MSDTQNRNIQPKGTWELSWRATAIAALLLALATLVALSVIATVKRADTLSVIALSLAIVAFVIQILVFIVQSSASTSQLLRAEEVHGATIRALATIEEKTEGTRNVVESINTRLLTAAIGKAVPEAASQGLNVDSPDFEQVLSQQIQNYLTRARATSLDMDAPDEGSPRRQGRVQTPAPRQSEPQEERLDRSVRTLPTGKFLDTAVAVVKQISMEGLMDLMTLARDQERYGARGSEGVSFLRVPEELYRHGLIKRITWRSGTSTVFVLTDVGKTVAALVYSDSLPQRHQEEVRAIRQKYSAAYAEQQERMRNAQQRQLELVPLDEAE